MSTVYKLMEEKIGKWKEKIEEEEKEYWACAKEKEIRQELEETLSEKSKVILKSYYLAVEDKFFDIYYCLCVKILNFGIKLGIELKSDFQEFDELF